jgi:hypothetical protein
MPRLMINDAKRGYFIPYSEIEFDECTGPVDTVTMHGRSFAGPPSTGNNAVSLTESAQAARCMTKVNIAFG